jgi:hypothetical protein
MTGIEGEVEKGKESGKFTDGDKKRKWIREEGRKGGLVPKRGVKMEKREDGWKGLREYRLYIIYNIIYNPLYSEDGASNSMKREKISFLFTVMNKRETVSRNLFL